MLDLHDKAGKWPARWATGCAFVALLGCSSKPTTHPTPEAAPAPVVGAASYRVRGVVTELQGSGEQARLVIQHEAIPEFKDRDGNRVGMASMTMPFALAAGARGLAHKGDRLEFTFETRWQQRPALWITGLKKLPKETKLVFDEGSH